MKLETVTEKHSDIVELNRQIEVTQERLYSTSAKIALFSAMVPWHALSSHLAKNAVSGHAQYRWFAGTTQRSRGHDN